MNISYNWLKEYVNFDLTPVEVEKILTSIGLEVEHFEEVEEIPEDRKIYPAERQADLFEHTIMVTLLSVIIGKSGRTLAQQGDACSYRGIEGGGVEDLHRKGRPI